MKNSFINFMAYFAIAIIALTLLVQYVLAKMGVDVLAVSIISTVTQAVAYFVAGVAAFNYARSKKSLSYIIFYFICLLVLIVFLILNVRV